MRLFLSALALLFWCAGPADVAGEQAVEPPHDLVVYGATSGGIAAAIQARRMGKTVVLIEPGRHLGGLTSSGLGWTDSGEKAVVGGIAREFYQRVKQHYDNPAAWKYQTPRDYGRYRPTDDAMWTFEPHVAEKIYVEMLAECQVPVFRNQRLDRAEGVRRDGARIIQITMESGEAYRGRMFIDATYEGDLMAAAGVRYTVGRESNSQYGETLNGVQKAENLHNHRFLKPVDPYRNPGEPASGLLPGVHGDPPGEDGQGDQRIQAYCFRLCMSNVPQNSVPFPRPANYDELRYELLLRNFEAGDLRLPFKPDMMPNGKTDTNNNCAFSTDNIGMNYDYPEASYQRRAEIVAEHESYQQGLMWTLANHPRVPESIRREMAEWGLAKDEFTDNQNWPHQIYVREARRMVGEYVMTEHDCRRTRVTDDSVGMGSYNMDSHNVQRYVTPEGDVQNEGDVQVSPGGAYAVSYRALVPQRGECENLLVPVCLSSSHIAYGSIRMEPVFMILGQSAATAAVHAIDDGVAVQDVALAKLQERLLADKQVLRWQAAPRSNGSLNPQDLAGVVLDDQAMERIGVWLPSTSIGGFVGSRYWHDNHESPGEKLVRFTYLPQEDGYYEIRLAYTANANRATNVKVTVAYGAGEDVSRVNQRRPPPIDKVFVSLGKFSLVRDRPLTITISNADADGYVTADAVQLVPVE